MLVANSVSARNRINRSRDYILVDLTNSEINNSHLNQYNPDIASIIDLTNHLFPAAPLPASM